MISFVLCQSPYFIALFRSAPWWPYRFWKIRSWSLRPPYVLLGAASFTVARVRFCCWVGAAAVARRVAAVVAGSARWAAAARADEAGACLASILNAVCVCARAIDACGAASLLRRGGGIVRREVRRISNQGLGISDSSVASVDDIYSIWAARPVKPPSSPGKSLHVIIGLVISMQSALFFTHTCALFR